MKLLLYCTKAKPMLRIAKEEFKGQKRARTYSEKEKKYFTEYIAKAMYEANGKIVAECDFEVEEIKCVDDGYFVWYEGKTLDEYKLLEQSCLNETELFDYLQSKFGYAIHIKNLHIFDEPKELSEYGMDFPISPIVKAPQNMMYANGIGERYILISIRPEWLCKILNGEKTIEVRKKVLKEML